MGFGRASPVNTEDFTNLQQTSRLIRPRRAGWQCSPRWRCCSLGKKNEPGPANQEEGNNWANFIEVLRGRDRSKQFAPIEEGALSVQLVHLANISYRTGRTLQFDAEKFTVAGDAEANAMFTRKYRDGFVVGKV